MIKKKATDLTIVFAVASLVTIGIIMVFSASYTYSLVQYNDGLHYLKRMGMWTVLGSLGMFMASKIKYIVWKRWSKFILVVSLVALLLLFTPLGITVKGATRWLGVGPIRIMPSEIAKLGIIIYLAASIENKGEGIRNFFTGVLPYLVLGGVFFYLIDQHDFSTAIVVIAIMITMVFIGGMKISHFALLSGVVFSGIGYMLYQLVFVAERASYRTDRLMTFVDPWAYAQGDGYQIIQSLYALGAGGILGKGLGKSVQKHLYLPEAHNDFIFSIIGEELGFIGGLFVMLLFMLLIWKGIKIAMNAPDLFGTLVATGIVTMIAVQVIINIAVATSSMPVTGMPLPFISYGGSSLLIFMTAMGIMINISKYCDFTKGGTK
ncbi:putative lipid II flippase FtsW [Isachenkonia alkalipeptolytica]|uniref:Probable peptidoglycan glycosyltransferase FtsW n=1 Tax=Isachenkonia alkalipeptolytica TaxID=2565777 RepID=A0AA43XLL9_9CLOT|nr:putative lipid II flippase FtsW [Isachenkonia alkalipeptolytica]NBG88519.1 putative lipid II flippase FtsW [Isachenkonia alkalipeptolytica]